MGNTPPALTTEKTDELIQRHIFMMHSSGYNDVLSLNEFVFQLNETHFFKMETTKLILAHKLFLKREDESKMKVIEGNLRLLNSKISPSDQPYFLLSHSIPQPANILQGLPTLSRQHLHSTLEDRMMAGIAMCFEEKINLSIQLLVSVLLLHNHCGFFHGNLSCSNVFLSSDSTAYLGDFAPYKPLYLDNSKFDEVKLFHPNIIEKCYLAPEKIDSEKALSHFDYSKLSGSDIKALQSMDLFALGCLLSELFLPDSNPLFTYETMLAYKKGDLSCLDRLQSIQNSTVREMISCMVSLDPAQRGSIQDHVDKLKAIVPEEMLNLYVFINYALRRGEFSQPDVKLGMLRLIAPQLLSSLQTHMKATNDLHIVQELFEDTIFRRSFPYQLSKLSIFETLRQIVSVSPLKAFFSSEAFLAFIGETMTEIEAAETSPIKGSTSPTAVAMDHLSSLGESRLEINRPPFTAKDEYKDEEDRPEFDKKTILERIFAESKKSMEQTEVLQKFTSLTHVIFTICSLLRNLQLNQSYPSALEMLEILSRFVRDEHKVFIIIPHLQTQVQEQTNKLEIYYSIDLFCKLIKRINHLPPILAKSAAYSGYIKSFIDCKNDSQLKKHVFRNLHSFIRLNLIFTALGHLHKMRRANPLVTPQEVVADILNANPSTFKDLLDHQFFTALIGANCRNEAAVIELLKIFPLIGGFLENSTMASFVKATFELYALTADIAFKTEALKSIASIMHRLEESETRDCLNRMKSLLSSSMDFIEIASILQAFILIFKTGNLPFLEKCLILVAAKQFLVHPCNLINCKVHSLVRLMFEQSTPEDIALVLSPLLSDFVDYLTVPDFETFQLTCIRPITYPEYNKMIQASFSEDPVHANEAMRLFLNYFDKNLNKTNDYRQKKVFKPREMAFSRSVPKYIQETLGSVVIYQILERIYSGRIETEFEKVKDLTKEKLLEKISQKLQEHRDKLIIHPYWPNKTDNYNALLKFKTEDADPIQNPRGYKFIKQFNISVLKMCMNYLQMIVHQTKLNFVSERAYVDKPEDLERLTRLKKWRPTGTLLTSINSHEGPVKCLASVSKSVFVSGSHDGHVKYHSLPALSRNFIHNSVLDIDLSVEKTESGEQFKVNQLHHLKQASKLVIIGNSNDILLCPEGLSTVQSRFKSSGRVTAATLYNEDEFKSCIACVNTNCDFELWDIRQPKPAMVYELSKIRGVPSSICRISGEHTNMISTFKGYLLNHDIRTNLTMSTSRLIYEKKQIPVVSVTQFIPHTNFRNIESKEDMVVLTYPSKCNQFSVFSTNVSSKALNPKIHFESRQESKTSKPVEVPFLEEVTQKEIHLELGQVCEERFKYLEDLYLREDNNLGLGQAFSIRTVRSVAGLYNDQFHKEKLNIKRECLKNFSDVMQTLSSMGECNMTVNKVLSLPGRCASHPGLVVDNILLSAGSDKNIRFMAFDNDLEKVESFGEEFDVFNCYHLSNMDNQPRSFRYAYSQGTCLLKEALYTSGNKDSEGSQHFGLSKYHRDFLFNRKTSDTLPGHAASINDLVLVENKDCLFVVSGGDDGAVKVWI